MVSDLSLDLAITKMLIFSERKSMLPSVVQLQRDGTDGAGAGEGR